MRPRALDEVVGQQHLLGRARAAAAAGRVRRADVAGPVRPAGHRQDHARARHLPGHQAPVRPAVALDSGVKEVRAVITAAKRELTYAGRRTVLFIDEVHRFSKTQQDSLLSAVEDRIVSLIAATTENPFFSVVSPLLSRSLVLALQPLSDDDIRAVLHRALTSDRGLDGAVTLTEEAQEHLVRIAGGDARKALTALESGAGAALAVGHTEIDLATLETAVAQAAVRYDRQGDQHYDVASALIKSIRGSDVDAALHYLARMVSAGEDPRFIARRLVISASEDIGMADPTALLTAVAAADAVAFIGMPEGHFPLAQAVVHLATAPKSNAVTVGIERVDGRRARRAGRAGAARPARRPLRRREEARARQDLRLSARPPRRRRPPAVPARRAGGQGLLPADQPGRRGADRRAAGQAAGDHPTYPLTADVLRRAELAQSRRELPIVDATGRLRGGCGQHERRDRRGAGSAAASW